VSPKCRVTRNFTRFLVVTTGKKQRKSQKISERTRRGAKHKVIGSKKNKQGKEVGKRGQLGRILKPGKQKSEKAKM